VALQEPLEAPSGGANGQEDAAQKAFFANLRGDLTQDDRHALYKLASGDPKASFHVLDGRQRNKVQRWARQIESEDLRLEHLDTGPVLFTKAGEVEARLQAETAALS
jgi:hypothetical protein